MILSVQDDRELRETLASVIEALAATDWQVGELAASLIALRSTLAEMGADFEARYAKHLSDPVVRQVEQKNAVSREVLLQIVRSLRGQS
jgi:hypothetical protein